MSITTPPKDYRKLFLDMNSYFASVEQQVQPTLRGQPVGIAPYTGDSGCIIARSTEAKQLGVKTGQRVGEARALCPRMIIVESRPELYLFYHRQILKVLENHSPYITPLSIDEFVINLTGSDQSEKKSLLMAKSIKQMLNAKVGDYLKCSIGVGPSTWLAKVAGESKKPDGLTVITTSGLTDLYRKLKLLDLPGINWRMERQFLQRNLKTPLDLYRYPLANWQSTFGHLGRTWYFRLRGYEVDYRESATKTIGHSHVLAPEFRSRAGAYGVLKKLIAKTGKRLRNQKLTAACVYVHIGFWGQPSFHVGRKTPEFSDDFSLNKYVFGLLTDLKFSARPARVAITVFNLKPAIGRQLSIFPELEKRISLSKATDNINDRYGAKTVHLGDSHAAIDTAPDRIPFGKPRYEILNF
jgi:DNA polymerase-4